MDTVTGFGVTLTGSYPGGALVSVTVQTVPTGRSPTLAWPLDWPAGTWIATSWMPPSLPQSTENSNVTSASGGGPVICLMMPIEPVGSGGVGASGRQPPTNGMSWVSAPTTLSTESAMSEPLMWPGPTVPCPNWKWACGARMVPGQDTKFLRIVVAVLKFHSRLWRRVSQAVLGTGRPLMKWLSTMYWPVTGSQIDTVASGP